MKLVAACLLVLAVCCLSAPTTTTEDKVLAKDVNVKADAPVQAKKEEPKAEVTTEAKKEETKEATPAAKTQSAVQADAGSDIFSVPYAKGGSLNNFGDAEPTQTVAAAELGSDTSIFFGPPTFGGTDPTVVRTKRVDAGFETVLTESPCNDGTHWVEETLDYLVVKNGELPSTGSSGVVFQGKIALNNGGVSQDTTFDFPKAFDAAPICFASLQSRNDEGYLAVRVKATTATQVTARLEVSEDKKAVKNGPNFSSTGEGEDIAFLCVSAAGKFSLGDKEFTVGTVETGRGTHVENSFALNGATRAVLTTQTVNGGNPCNLRKKSSSSDYKFIVDEDKCNGSERFHVSETVAYLTF